MAHEKPPERRDAVDYPHAEIAYQSYGKEIIRHQAVQAIRSSGQDKTVEPPPALIAGENIKAPKIEPKSRRIKHRFGEGCGIFKAEIEPLPCYRMDGMSGIADECEAVFRIGSRKVQSKRIGPAWTGGSYVPQMRAKAQCQRRREVSLVELNQAT